MIRTARFRASVLLLTLFLTAPAAFASGKGGAEERTRGFFAPLWEAVSVLLPHFVKSHGGMDPDGQPAPPAPPSGGTTESDSHGGMDPDGRT
jgi:hypothetical protein